MKFFNKKNASGIVSALGLLAGIAALISFLVMRNVAAEPKDMPGFYYALAGAFLVCSIAACVKDFFKVPSLLAYIAATAGLFVYAAGRVDYVAFYVTGDIMGTGLSAAFLLTGIFQLLAVILSAAAVCVSGRKAPQKNA